MTKKLIDAVIEGIQEKKGRNIVIVDLSEIYDTLTNYLIICEGNSPTQVAAITDSVKEFARKKGGAKPTAVDGTQNNLWVALDYSEVAVHIFVPDAREYYDLEGLWEDAEIEEIPNLD